LDLARHQRFGHSGLFEHADALAELTERNPVHRRRWRFRGALRQIRKGFFFDGDDGDVIAGAACRVEHQKRKASVPGYQAEPLHSSASTSSARRVARRRMTPRVEERMNSTRYWTSGQES